MRLILLPDPPPPRQGLTSDMEYPAISTTVAEIFSGLCSRLPYSRTRQRTFTGCRNMCCPSSAEDKHLYHTPVSPGPQTGPSVQLGLPLPPQAERHKRPKCPGTSDNTSFCSESQVLSPKHLCGNPALPSETLTLVKVVTRRAAQVCEAWRGDGFLLAGLHTNGPLCEIVTC